MVVLSFAFTFCWIVVQKRRLRKKTATAETSRDDAKIPPEENEMEVGKHFKKFRIDH